MKFEPNYITSDGAFEIQIDMNRLTYETRPPEANWTTKKHNL